MLTAEAEPRRRFAYIAGNWSLDDGARDPSLGGCRAELLALKDAGCYADFTFPALGSRAQPRTTNAIYYAKDDPGPKSYDSGVVVAAGRPASGDLMLVQGPSLFDRRRGGFEAAAIESFAPPDPRRLDAWTRANVHVAGRPEWIFVKLHTHGMQSREALLGAGLGPLFEAMQGRWNRPPFRLHFVTAREMYNIIKAAEAGLAGDAGLYRDFEVPQPANRVVRCDRPWELLGHDATRVALKVHDPGPTCIEFKHGPLRRIRGRIRALEARFADGLPPEVRIVGEGGCVTDPPLDCHFERPDSALTAAPRGASGRP
jgi:hypothetical protein